MVTWQKPDLELEVDKKGKKRWAESPVAPKKVKAKEKKVKVKVEKEEKPKAAPKKGKAKQWVAPKSSAVIDSSEDEDLGMVVRVMWRGRSRSRLSS